MRPIRVCMVSYFYHPNYSGAGTQCRNLCRALAGRGVEPLVVAARVEPEAPKEEVIDGVPVYRLRFHRRHPVLRLVSFWANLSSFLIRNRKRYDIVHIHRTLQPAAAAFVARLLGKKSVLKVTMARDDLAFQWQGRLFGRLNRFAVGLVDRYIATSREIQEEIAETGLDTSRVMHVPNGVDLDRFRPPAGAREKATLRAQLGLPDEPLALYVGALVRRKNLEFLLRVWGGITENGRPGKLVLVGPALGEPEYLNRLKTVVRDKKLADRVVFTGLREEVPQYLRAADVFLFSPLLEGMPNVLLEAMASGLPAVVTQVSGAPEVIKHGRNGFLFAQGDREGFGCAVEEVLWGEPNPLLGVQARRTVEEGYSLAAVADRYRQIYRELMGQAPDAPEPPDTCVAPDAHETSGSHEALG